MTSDRQGNVMTGADAGSAARFDAAVTAFNLYRGDPLAELDAALAEAPGHVMAHALKAWLLGLATEPAAAAEAAQILDRARPLQADERERSHLGALALLLRGDWNAAATALDLHNARWPHDIVALQAGHVMDFYRGSARDLRDRVARVLPRWGASLPCYGALLGMHAFGLEETGDYGRAEEAGRRAIDLEPRDCWAHHAVAHVMEMQGRAQDGIGWMVAREPFWAEDANFFKVHNWWHRALCHLDLGQAATVLELYDGAIRGGRSAVALDLVDASALLWRLGLAGIDAGDRWAELAATWDRHADGRLYPFNDWHAAMAYLGAGRDADVEALLARLRESGRGESEVAGWARSVAIPLIEAFRDFHRGRYAEAVAVLHRVRFSAQMIGGSHAQRDIIDWTLTEAALRGGLRDLAAGFAAERLALKPHSPINRDFLRRAGDPSPAPAA